MAISAPASSRNTGRCVKNRRPPIVSLKYGAAMSTVVTGTAGAAASKTRIAPEAPRPTAPSKARRKRASAQTPVAPDAGQRAVTCTVRDVAIGASPAGASPAPSVVDDALASSTVPGGLASSTRGGPAGAPAGARRHATGAHR